MKRTIHTLHLFVIFLTASMFAQTDVEESKDHHLITRYPGSHIAYYDEQEFSTYSIATGPVTGYKTISEWTDVEGNLHEFIMNLKIIQA